MPFLNEAFGKLLTRLGVGGLMLFHGVHKLIHGHEFIQTKLAEAGLPEFLTWGVPVGEVLAPILIIVGLATRTSALIVAFTMIMSIYLVFAGQLFSLNQVGGWVAELNALFLLSSLAIFFHGPGKLSLDHKLNLKY